MFGIKKNNANETQFIISKIKNIMENSFEHFKLIKLVQL
jgi:hypothetical protein